MYSRGACRGCGRTLALCSCPSGEDELGEGPTTTFATSAAAAAARSFGAYHAVPPNVPPNNIANKKNGVADDDDAAVNANTNDKMHTHMLRRVQQKMPLHSGAHPPHPPPPYHPATANNVHLYPKDDYGDAAKMDAESVAPFVEFNRRRAVERAWEAEARSKPGGWHKPGEGEGRRYWADGKVELAAGGTRGKTMHDCAAGGHYSRSTHHRAMHSFLRSGGY